MDRREAIKKTLGAIVGVSAIPAFGQKPKIQWRVVSMSAYAPSTFPEGIGFTITRTHVSLPTSQRPV